MKSGGRVFFLRADEIDWIEAAGNYVRLHLGEDSHLLRETMNSIEARLDPRRFFRIHRSHIVNIERIKELQPWFNGEYVVILQNGARLTLSRGIGRSCRSGSGSRCRPARRRHERCLAGRHTSAFQTRTTWSRGANHSWPAGGDLGEAPGLHRCYSQGDCVPQHP